MKKTFTFFIDIKSALIVAIIFSSAIAHNQSIPLSWKQQADAVDASIHPTDIVVDTDGFIYVGGYFGGQIYAGTNHLTALTAPTADMFILKLDPSGQFVWCKSYGNSESDYLLGMAIDHQNNLLICGQIASDSIIFDSQIIFTGNSNQAGFFAKINTNGMCTFAQTVRSDAPFQALAKTSVNSITSDTDGNVYITGGFRGDSLMINTISFINQRPASQVLGSNIFVAKFNSTGVCQWIEGNEPGTVPGGNEAGLSVCVDKFNHVFIAGVYGGAKTVLGSTTLGTFDLEEGFCASYNSDGSFNWARAIRGFNLGSNTYDNINCIVADSYGHLYIGGNYVGSELNFDSLYTYNTPLNPNANKGFMFKLNAANGLPIWNKILGESAIGSASLAEITLNSKSNELAIACNYNGSVTFDNLSFTQAAIRNGALLIADTSGHLTNGIEYFGANKQRFVSCKYDLSGAAIACGYYDGSISHLGNQFDIQNQYVTNSFNSLIVCKSGIQPYANIESNKELTSLFVFPNPTTDRIYLSGFSEVESVEITIYSIKGELIRSEKLPAPFSLSVGEIKSGSYILLYKTETKNGILKFNKV